MTKLEALGARTKAAARVLMTAATTTKNAALEAAAAAIEAQTPEILAANEKDLAAALAAGMANAMLDRLALSEERLKGIADGVREVAQLPDPVGTVLSETERPNGLKIQKVSVPLGVIAVIF